MTVAKPIYKLCIDDAEEFFSVAELSRTNGIIKHITPYIVNLSFACELYVKGILLYEKKTVPPIHDLKQLYQSISETAKNVVRGEYTKLCGKTTIDDFFVHHRQVFKKWRYAFEEKHMEVNLCALEAFAQSLQTYCNTLN